MSETITSVNSICCRRPKMIYALLLFSCLLLSPFAGRRQLNTEATDKPQHSSSHHSSAHPPVYADTKYWIRSTEFGERDNWLHRRRPCTLFERIKMSEQSVVSMGSSMDALAGSVLNGNTIKELTLAMNGMLLLEDDLPEDPIKEAFIDYLKLMGDCVDGEAVLAAANIDQQPTVAPFSASNRYLFEFKPDSDQMSWFNPDNWMSAIGESDLIEWIPDSHQVPCSEDVVIFGDRHALLAPVLETGERDKTVTFKVNFRASQASQLENGNATTRSLVNSIDPVRVSRLFIGQRQYDQQDLLKLIYSDDYEDILFQFNDSASVLRANQGYYPDGSPLIIDESSLIKDSSQNICLDEAGCVCANEQAEVMKVICSFHEPLSDHDLPCHDPIYSAGYCNKICATSLMINMDPSRFSERFLASIIGELINEAPNAGTVLVGPRRIDDDKYEIIFRYIPNDDEFWSSPGIERDLAEAVLQQLLRGSTKSFYGIRGITIKSSVQWRQNNRSIIFWLTTTMILLITVVILAHRDSNDRQHNSISSANDTHWLTSIWYQVGQDNTLEVANSDSLTKQTVRTGTIESGDSFGSLSNIPLVDLDESDSKDSDDKSS